jgi:uncharacterized cofD-like protein
MFPAGSVDEWFKHCYHQIRMDRPSSQQKLHIRKRLRQSILWLTPGLGVKRWFFVILLGITLLAVGVAFLVLDFYRNSPGTWWLPYFSALSLRFLERPLRVLIFGGIGIGLFVYGIWGLNQALLKPFIRPDRPLLETVTACRRRERGPRIVAIGGGTGLSTLLRGLKGYTHNLTAIVTVADDGGSSGELRRNMGILPPGDIRNCLAALSNDEALMAQIFQYRFASGAGLNGHSRGNLFITALTEITGSFEEAIAESGRVLAVHGRVLPSTLHDVRLGAEVTLSEPGQVVQVRGESMIPRAAGKVRRVWLEPNNPSAFPPTIQALLTADLIVVGPGSLYTSILPNLLVPDIASALRASRAIKFYVCNITTQQGETDGYSCGDHIHTLSDHLGENLFDLVICNSNFSGRLPENIQWVKNETDLAQDYPCYQADLVDNDLPSHHQSHQLAQTIMDLFYEKTGPLSL